jgi:hypothetical protein
LENNLFVSRTHQNSKMVLRLTRPKPGPHGIKTKNPQGETCGSSKIGAEN